MLLIHRMTLVVLAVTSILVSHTTMADSLDGVRIAMIDSHALAAPPHVESSPTSLARYLAQPARDEVEKARAIFRWVTDRINYDVDAYFSNRLEKMTADDVLRQRRSICDGYANLFEQLGREAGLEVVTIKGYAKAYGHTAGTRFDKPNHAWNAIRINGQWRLVDSTWGAGYVRNGRYVKVLTETYFLASPEQMMFSHFPNDETWQLQSTPRLTKAEFEALPDIEPAFFYLGVAGEEVWRAMKAPDFSGSLVRTYDLPYHIAIVQKAPLSYRLRTGQSLEFKIQSDTFEKMAIVQNDKWTDMSKEDRVFTLATTANESGDMLVLGKKPGSEEFTAILGYTVRR